MSQTKLGSSNVVKAHNQVKELVEGARSPSHKLKLRFVESRLNAAVEAERLDDEHREGIEEAANVLRSIRVRRADEVAEIAEQSLK